MKAQAQCRTQNLQRKATKTFHATKVLRKERKRLSGEGCIYNKYLFHAIDSTANQNTGKSLYIPRYYIQPSHDARVMCVCRFDCVDHCIFYGMV